MLRILAALTAVAAYAGWAVLIAAHTLSNASTVMMGVTR